MLQTRVHGRDRVEFMESICTADVAGLADGAAALTVFTNEQGGIVDDLIVTKVREGNHLYVVSNAGCRDKDIPLMVRKAEEMKRYNTLRCRIQVTLQIEVTVTSLAKN